MSKKRILRVIGIALMVSSFLTVVAHADSYNEFEVPAGSSSATYNVYPSLDNSFCGATGYFAYTLARGTATTSSIYTNYHSVNIVQTNQLMFGGMAYITSSGSNYSSNALYAASLTTGVTKTITWNKTVNLGTGTDMVLNQQLFAEQSGTCRTEHHIGLRVVSGSPALAAGATESVEVATTLPSPTQYINSTQEVEQAFGAKFVTPAYLPDGIAQGSMTFDPIAMIQQTSYVAPKGRMDIVQSRKAIGWLDHDVVRSEKGVTVYHTLNTDGKDVWVVERKLGQAVTAVVTTLPLEEAVRTAESLQ